MKEEELNIVRDLFVGKTIKNARAQLGIIISCIQLNENRVDDVLTHGILNSHKKDIEEAYKINI